MDPSFGTLETDAPALEAPGWDTPFRFAILGDFSAREARKTTEGVDDIAARKSKKVDRENIDAVLEELDVNLLLKMKGGDVELTFTSLEDFHPDRIVAKVERFDDLPSPKDKSALLSQILHHADFRALESAWLGLDWFLRKAWKPDNGVEVVLYDLATSEFAECLNADEDLSQSPLYHWLVEKAQKGYHAQPWGAILGLYSFEMTAANAQVLGRMARIARHASAPFLAAVTGKVWDKSFKVSATDTAAWEKLRNHPEAAMLGLATPGFLLRPPYGAGTKPIDRFPYEEYRTAKDQAYYVWGNPGLVGSALLAKSFTKKNWSFKPGADLDLDDMPMHVARDEDDQEVLMTVQAWLAQPAIDKLIKQGLMPIRGVKGRNSIQLARFLPISNPPPAAPAADLVGSWGQKALKGVPRSATKAPIRTMTAGLTAGDTGMTEEAKAKRAPGREGDFLQPVASTSKAGKGGRKKFDLDDIDALSAAVDELEAERKKEEEERAAQEAAAMESSSSDSSDFGSSDLGSDMSTDMPSDDSSSGMSDLDAQLAALSAGGDTSGSSSDTSTEMDPEIAALLAEAEGDGSAPSSEEPPAEEPPAEEMDPEIAALLKQMEEGSS